jgi:alcohol dehydrogenase class IV
MKNKESVMANKKSKTNTDEEKIAKARKKRLALAEEKGIQKKSQEKDNGREDFRKYFLKLNKKLNLNKSLEEVIWIHLKTIGCNRKELFDKGIKHFGYKI